MSNFSSALEQALSGLKILKQDFAKTIGVGRGVVSSYTGALIPIGARTVARVCAALPMPHSARVLRGYLLDQIPEGSEGTLKIEVQHPGAETHRELPEMDDELATAFTYLVGRAMRENIFRSLVVDLYQATVGDPTDPNAHLVREESEGAGRTLDLDMNAPESGLPPASRAKGGRAAA